MAEKEVECCDAVEVHENLLKIVNVRRYMRTCSRL